MNLKHKIYRLLANLRQRTSRLFCAISVSVIAAFSLNPPANADIIHVKASASCPGDGIGWGTAYKYLQDALADAALGDQIWVAAGTYYPDQDCANPDGSCDPGPCDRDADFQLIQGVKLYGGFDGTETFLVDRDPENNITILSGDIDQDDGPGEFENNDDNSYHVVTADDVGSTTIINGFWITAGNADDIFSPDNGGGGMLIFDASPIVVRSTFAGNFGASFGGAISIPADGSSSPIFVNCSFLSNTADGQGGGAVFFIDSSATFTNCLFSGNVGKTHGGALFAGGSTSVVTNCTFSGNSVTLTDGGGVHVMDGSATLANCVFWGNTPDQIHANSGTTSVSFSDVEGGIPAEVTDDGGNIDDDPLFVDEINGDFRLLANSPCIDTADNVAIPDDAGDLNDNGDPFEETPYDLDLLDRTQDSNADCADTVDMGAYEFQPCLWDLDDDCSVGASDLLALLAVWGTDPGAPPDFDCDSDVGASDLLTLLDNWGLCPCGTGSEPLSLGDELDDACLSSANWADFLDKMETGSSAQQQNYICWLTHYFEDCTRCICIGASGCPGADPFN